MIILIMYMRREIYSGTLTCYHPSNFMSRQEHRQPSMATLICSLGIITYRNNILEGTIFVLLNFVEWIG
jgi:hypothetical protein